MWAGVLATQLLATCGCRGLVLLSLCGLAGRMADDNSDGGSMDVDLSDLEDIGEQVEPAEQLLPSASDKETTSLVSEAV